MEVALLVALLLGLSFQKACAECTGSSSSLLEAECNAWIALFDATSGSSWSRCSSLRSDPCSCQQLDWDARFVSCVNGTADASVRHISEISMYGNAMKGTLPLALKNLSELVSISLLENEISGALDASLCSLPKLEYIRMGGLNVYRAMAGGIPRCLFVKAGIKGIWLRNTQLGGTAPAEFASSLIELGLQGNNLTGPLPSFNYSQFSVHCNLESNPFSCPLPVGVASKCGASCTHTDILSARHSSSWVCECASSPTTQGICYTRWRCCTDSSMADCDDKYAWGDKPECKSYCDKKSTVPTPAEKVTRAISSAKASWSCECASTPTSKGDCYTRWRCCTDSNMTECDETVAWGDKPECKTYCDKKDVTRVVV